MIDDSVGSSFSAVPQGLDVSLLAAALMAPGPIGAWGGAPYRALDAPAAPEPAPPLVPRAPRDCSAAAATYYSADVAASLMGAAAATPSPRPASATFYSTGAPPLPVDAAAPSPPPAATAVCDSAGVLLPLPVDVAAPSPPPAAATYYSGRAAPPSVGVVGGGSAAALPAATGPGTGRGWHGLGGMPPVLPLSPVGSVATLSSDELEALLTSGTGGGGGGCGSSGGGMDADVKPRYVGGGWDKMGGGGGGGGGYPSVAVGCTVSGGGGDVKPGGGGGWGDDFSPMDHLGLHRGAWGADPPRPPFC